VSQARNRTQATRQVSTSTHQARPSKASKVSSAAVCTGSESEEDHTRPQTHTVSVDTAVAENQPNVEGAQQTWEIAAVMANLAHRRIQAAIAS
jgi:hypothetical protein